jgi:threonine synthase
MSLPLTQNSHVDPSARSIWRYRGLFPISADVMPVSLGEGLTPLIRARSAPAGISLFLKNETLNPTGSHKDRALSVSITKAVELGHRTVMLYSDGSTALSSAAYSSRAGLRSITLVACGTPEYRLLPLAFYNSAIFEYQGDSADALTWAHETCVALGLYETSTYREANPYGMHGAKTISYEIVEQLGKVPAWVIVPVGGGGTLCAIWQGFQEMRVSGQIKGSPRLAAVMPAGYTVLEKAFLQDISTEEGMRSLVSREAPPTMQSKIAMPHPPDGLETIRAIRESDGLFLYVNDEQVIQGQHLLGREGIFAEPSAAGVISALEALSKYDLREQDAVVALVTGSGFRELGAVSHAVRPEKHKIESATGIDEIRRWVHKWRDSHGSNLSRHN